MRFTFNVDLPEKDLRVGDADMQARSYVGYDGREDKRFFPLVKSLECLTAINVWQWHRATKEGRHYPWLYQSGVYYQQEPVTPIPQEEWLDFPTLYKVGYGDCEDLAAARAGELQFCGVAAVPCIRYKQFGMLTVVHVLVLHPDGNLEDPSKFLGMKGSE